ncbi:MAG TPA: V-type ATPase subunit [Clostridiales bacterium]|nr:V-type ATPase subunit [Clostridiales bacterium]
MMLATLASNAILSKARAMYGRRLTEQDYKELLNCQNVSEVAFYLKNQTHYKQVLAGINENAVHRGQLEAKLKQKQFEDYDSLCRYEITVGERFAKYLLVHSEIEQILHVLILLDAGKPEEYLFELPMYLSRHASMDMDRLSKIRSYDDLLLVLDRTPYREILEPFKPVKDVPINFTGIENALYGYLYRNLYEVIDHYTKGEARKELHEIFDSYLDLDNYSRIVRMKVSYQCGADFIQSSLLPFGSLDPATIKQMVDAETEQQISEIMHRTKIGRRALDIPYSYVDEIPKRMLYKICRHNIYFSTHPAVVMMSYLFLVQCERTDIITIVEGVRYKLPPDEILKLLIIPNYRRKE